MGYRSDKRRNVRQSGRCNFPSLQHRNSLSQLPQLPFHSNAAQRNALLTEQRATSFKANARNLPFRTK
jgi:hypothetical protein